MKRMWMFVVAMLGLVSSAIGTGFVITEENDVFLKKDNNYTQGLEMYVTDTSSNKEGKLIKENWGLRSRMYTPDDITASTNQPGDRPWCGVTTVFYEWTEKRGDEYVMTGWEVGTMGPESGVEWQQKTIHKMIGSHTPMGWSNQVPNEISIQFYMTHYRQLERLGTSGKWMADLDMPYGFVGGTTFDNVSGGLSARAGYNIPPAHYGGDIEPKAILPKPFFYFLADGSGKCVLHNATLGHSFFRSHDDTEWDRDLIPLVGEFHYGVCVGYKNFAVTYMNEYRKSEFVGQPDPFKCGMIRLEFTQLF